MQSENLDDMLFGKPKRKDPRAQPGRRQGKPKLLSADDCKDLTFDQIMAKLPVQHAAFVAEILRGKSNIEAATAAWPGLRRGAAWQRITRLLGQNTAVKLAVDLARAALAKKAGYDLEAAMAELDAKIAHFEKYPNQGMAIARMLELKGKLMGLYIDRLDQRTISIPLTIDISGIGDIPGISNDESNHLLPAGGADHQTLPRVQRLLSGFERPFRKQ
jgi:cyanate lyase